MEKPKSGSSAAENNNYNKWYYLQNKTYPVRLGEYKIPLMKFSYENSLSLQQVVILAIKEFCERNNLQGEMP